MRPWIASTLLLALACTGGPEADGPQPTTVGGLTFEVPADWTVTEQSGVQEGVRLNVVIVEGPRHTHVRLHHFRAETAWTPTSFARHLLETQPSFAADVPSRFRTGQDAARRTILGSPREGVRIPLVLTSGPADLPYHAEIHSVKVQGRHLVTYHQLSGVPDDDVESAVDRIYDTLELTPEARP